MTVKCLSSEATIDTIDEALNELDHLRGIFRILADQLSDEEHWAQLGAGDATGAILDQGLLLALGNERLERVINAGRALRRIDWAAKKLHARAAGQEG